MEKIRLMWHRYFWNAHAFVFALDAAAPDRFDGAKDELHRMYQWIEDPELFPFLVLANKTDLEGAVDLDTISRALDIGTLSKSKPGWMVAVKGISAMTGEGTDEALEWLTSNVSYKLIVQHNENKRHVVQVWRNPQLGWEVVVPGSMFLLYIRETTSEFYRSSAVREITAGVSWIFVILTPLVLETKLWRVWRKPTFEKAARKFI
ncbi:ADP-ribosylation factor family-domain-containing protein [Mycena epipterygia]|nr:ADP-ribosylation factor family-domain-containing protein [Mycena epipterygia]